MPDPSSLYAGYTASRYSKVRDTDLGRALKPYRLSLGFVRGGSRGRQFTDMDLRRLATRAVVKKHLLGKSGKTAPANYTSLSIAQLQAHLRKS